MQQSQSLGLSNLQLELLKLYSFDLPENQLKDIKKLLANYFAKQINAEMDQLWEEKGWDQSTIEKWKNTHMRTPYGLKNK